MRGLIGKKLSHSFSKIIHEKLDQQEYNLIELASLDSFFQERSFSAINVTIPYKNDVIKYLDVLSEEVRSIQACNTIVNDNGVLKGYNTDYTGFEFLLNYNNIDVSNKTVGILGNGSTTSTVKSYLNNKNVRDIKVFARSPKENEFKLKDINNHKNLQILINCTPVGMFPNSEKSFNIDFSKFKNIEAVVDVIYNPLRTNLLLDAEENGIKAVNGLLMLVHQAVKANELFNNTTHDPDVTVRIYKEIYKSLINYVIIGMPMSGKTFIARQIQSQYNKETLEIDAMIESKRGLTIPQIFEIDGEQEFRKLESSIISEVSKHNNKAISTGGGIILNFENIRSLKQNGLLIFLDVPYEDLQSRNPKNRPLLKDPKNLEKLFNERYDLYTAYADVTVEKRGYNHKQTLKDIEVMVNEYLST